jgi:large subunit ribosomal protein L22
MIEAHATAKYVRTSAQKAGLVLDLIRGRDVNRALATLAYTPKGIVGEIAKVLRSAIANAQQREGFGGDVDRLYVKACYANQGPSMKRVRPAPMGRAFRVVKRTAHLTVHVAERPVEIDLATPEPATQADAAKETAKPRSAKPAARAKSAKPGAGKRAAPSRKKAATPKRSRKK